MGVEGYIIWITGVPLRGEMGICHFGVSVSL